jgi:hypothetical protein
MKFPDDLRVGDILLYSEKDIIDDLIKWKTSGQVAHIEIYAGVGRSWASRNGIGVGQTTYPFRSEGLAVVRRPVQFFDADKASIYFNLFLKGLPYGFGDILANLGIDASTLKGVDCSHLAALLEQASGCPMFASDTMLNTISPRDFQIVREAITIYKA